MSNDDNDVTADGTPIPRGRGLHGAQTWVDQVVQQAQRRGDFEDLPGAGKPLQQIDSHTDPDWWVKGWVQRERLDLTDAMPTVMRLRREKATFPDALFELGTEEEVRRRVEDFNTRVLEDRQKPHTGPHSPPIVGRVDIEQMVQQWREHRSNQPPISSTEATATPAEEHPAEPRRRWWPGSRRR